MFQKLVSENVDRPAIAAMYRFDSMEPTSAFSWPTTARRKSFLKRGQPEMRPGQASTHEFAFCYLSQAFRGHDRVLALRPGGRMIHWHLALQRQ